MSKDYIPVGTYRNAISKEEALSQIELELEDDDDEPLDRSTFKKKRKKPKKSSEKPKKRTGSTSLTSSSSELRTSKNSIPIDSEIISLSSDEEDFESTILNHKTTSESVLENVPALAKTFQIAR